MSSKASEETAAVLVIFGVVVFAVYLVVKALADKIGVEVDTIAEVGRTMLILGPFVAIGVFLFPRWSVRLPLIFVGLWICFLPVLGDWATQQQPSFWIGDESMELPWWATKPVKLAGIFVFGALGFVLGRFAPSERDYR
jgi:hypothetical protein